MKTLQEQFNLINEGKGHKDVFLKEARSKYPDMVTNSATFDEATKILKNRGVISEMMVVGTPAVTPIESREKLDFETKFKSFISEENKVDKEVKEAEGKSFDYSDKKNLDNQIGQEVMNGVYFEAKQNPDKTIEEIKEIVSKNLAKDGQYYMKNAAFGVEGLGYKESKVEEVSGKHKESGYSDKLKALVKESLGQVVTMKSANPFSMASLQNQVVMDMLKEKEETNEGDTDAKRADDAKRLGKKGEENIFGAGVKKGEEVEKKKMKKVKKETIDSKLAEIEAAGKVTTLEAQIAALEEAIATKEQRLSLVNEDSEMAELLDKGKVNAMRKEIKLLEKRSNKMKKLYEKLSGGSYSAPVLDEENIDEMDEVSWNEKNNPTRSASVGERDPKKVGQTTAQYAINVK